MQNVGQRVWRILEKMLRAVLERCFLLLHRELSEELFQNILQFVRFGMVGVTNTIVSYVIYVVSLLALRRLGLFARTDYYIAQAAAFVLSVLWSFYWNNRLVFRLGDGEGRCLWKALLRTYVTYSFTGLFLNSILLFVWVSLLHISEFLAPIINLLVSVPINFLLNKFWAFRA